MRNVYEVLREKEKAVARVDQEIRILRLAVLLLTDGTDVGPIPVATPGDHGTAEAQRPSGTEVAGGVKFGTATKVSARLKRLTTPLLSGSAG